ncbi:hypothetical protein BH11PAT3_BH11PAT3_1210 [soil metagenome]
MPTTKERVNVILDHDLAQGVSLLAKRDKRSKASVLAELANEALELREDLAWAKIVKERTKDKRRYISHEKAWK